MASKTLAIDSNNGRLYASSANMNAVLIFDLNGNRIGSFDTKASRHTRWAIGTRSGEWETLCCEYAWESSHRH